MDRYYLYDSKLCNFVDPFNGNKMFEDAKFADFIINDVQ
jgi:hypothetical protein